VSFIELMPDVTHMQASNIRLKLILIKLEQNNKMDNYDYYQLTFLLFVAFKWFYLDTFNMWIIILITYIIHTYKENLTQSILLILSLSIRRNHCCYCSHKTSLILHHTFSRQPYHYGRKCYVFNKTTSIILVPILCWKQNIVTFEWWYNEIYHYLMMMVDPQRRLRYS
jgi:hypothetical protein